MSRQIRALEAGVEMVVATPGRLIDLIQRKAVSMESVEVAILDEADEMADMGFLLQVNQIMRRVPESAQVMLFSATLDYRVQSLVDKYMNDPVSHEVESETVTVEESEHRFLEVHHMDKPKVVARLAESHDRVMVFVRTKRNCDRVAADLRELGVDARAIHGDIQQSKRQKALDGFAGGKTEVLVATNVAARGLHVDGVGVVVHYDPPDDSRMYLHRSGRTARAGEAGLVVTFVEWDQKDAVRRIQREAGLHQPIVKMFSNDDRLDDLAAWEPPPDEAPAPTTTTRSTNRPRRRRRV
jgi:superfamily II DNA/RNA helicase